MKILLTGKNGQVGWELERALAPLGEVIACDHAGFDLANPDQIVTRMRACNPDIIVNPAAYTAVDKAEHEPELAQAINSIAPGILAEEAKRLGALLVHYSTDYVFDGSKANPYVETDSPNPINAYGRTKLAGERAIESSGCRYLILRTSWVYGLRGSNFLCTMLRLGRERPELRVVDDQIGAPTWCRNLARQSLAMLRADAKHGLDSGIYHATDGGETSWYGFASAILRGAHLATPVHPIATRDYPTAAARPLNSRLNNQKRLGILGVSPTPWQDALTECLAERP